MGWNPVKDAKKWFNKAKDEAEKGLNSIKNEAKNGVNKVGSEVRKGTGKIESVAKKAEGELEGGLKQIKSEVESIPDKAKDAVEECLKQALAAAASSTFTKAVDIAQSVAPDEMGLKIGPFGLTIGDVKDRIDTLQRWAQNPPTSKEHIKEMIITLAPTSVSVEVDVQFAAIVVSSDALEVGFSASWDTESFIEKFDDIVRHF